MRSTLLALLFVGFATATVVAEKPRLLILTDIGGDPDDQQSLTRLLLYANEFEIEGLIASAAGTPRELRVKTTRSDLIRQLVDAFGQVQANLSKHAPGYPTAEELLAKIKSGNPERGREAIGEGHDTEGSRWIIAAADKNDTRPLNISIWGGQTDLAQALWRVQADRGSAGLTTFISRIRIYDIADQDGIAAWIQEEFPGLFYVLAAAPAGRDKREGAFRGMYLGGELALVSREWMETHIRQGHGPLGALYPPRTWTAPNPSSAIKEGDTPSWLYFLPHGLNDPAHPEWGGFGGRFGKNEGGVYRDAEDTVGQTTDARATVWRWRPVMQADFQARLDWCLAGDFAQANHAPIAVVQGDATRSVVRATLKAGESITLSAKGTTDPDPHSVTYRWFFYREPSSFSDDIELSPLEGPETTVSAPPAAATQNVHIVLAATDSGEPPLTSYRRVVVQFEPR